MSIRLFAAVLAIAACAASPKQTNAPGQGSGSGSGSGVTCHEVTDTGSMFSHTECTPVEQTQAERDGAQDFLKHPRSSPTGGK